MFAHVNQLHEVTVLLVDGATQVVDHYNAYVNHVRAQSYHSGSVDPDAMHEGAAATWPAHDASSRLSVVPLYLGRRPESNASYAVLADEGEACLRDYYTYLDYVFQKRQEHLHPNGVPLVAWRRKDKPKECKHGFMEHHLLRNEARVMCQCVAKQLGVATIGRRNVVGAIEPARGSGSLNGPMRPISVGSGSNSDIKVPYRLPLLRATQEQGGLNLRFEQASVGEIIGAVNNSQGAQVGYHCGCSNKRQPIWGARMPRMGKGSSYVEPATVRLKFKLCYTSTFAAHRFGLFRSWYVASV